MRQIRPSEFLLALRRRKSAIILGSIRVHDYWINERFSEKCKHRMQTRSRRCRGEDDDRTNYVRVALASNRASLRTRECQSASFARSREKSFASSASEGVAFPLNKRQPPIVALKNARGANPSERLSSSAPSRPLTSAAPPFLPPPSRRMHPRDY